MSQLPADSVLFAFQLHNHQFRAVVKPQRYYAFSKPSTYYHFALAFIKKPCIVFRPKPLTRRKNAADKRQSELTAVSMTAEH